VSLFVVNLYIINNMADDWKLKARTVVKLKKTSDMLVSLCRVFFSLFNNCAIVVSYL